MTNMARSPKNQPDDVGPAERQIEGTRLESLEEIRRAVNEHLSPKPKEQPADAGTIPFRPLRRPPLALLCILDDGRDDGEWVRLRADQVVIGRNEGNINIQHDTMMSSRHAEISRKAVKGGYRWFLTDLDSTNGTWVRIAGVVLRDGQELLIGGRRYRFSAAQPGAESSAESKDDANHPQSTRGWQSVVAADLVPSLVELRSDGEGKRFFLTRQDNWIGSSVAQASVVLSDDPLVSPRHARVYRDAKGQWHIENAQSLNGLWIRVERLPLEGAAQFQLGEQRFFFKLL